MDHESPHQNPYTGYYGTKPQRHHRGCSVPMFFLAVFSLCILGLFYVRWDDDHAAGSAAPQIPVPEHDTASAAIHAADSVQTANSTDAKLVITPEPDEAPLTLQELYQNALPSVVSVLTPDGTGTGVILSDDGYIITNHHLVDQADALLVVLRNSAEHEAVLVGSDTVSDLAVLKIDAEDLAAAEFGDSSAVQVGDAVVSIANPLGPKLSGTMSDGIIAAINRDITTSGRTLSLFQTSIPGSGPLFNESGQIIAIGTARFGSYDADEQIGFAIPTEAAKGIVDALIERGYVAGQPAIGFRGTSVPAYVQSYYSLPAGVYVSEVDPETAGLDEGDIIIAANDTAVASLEELNAVKNQFAAGDQITLTVWHSGETLEITVTLVDRNDME